MTSITSLKMAHDKDPKQVILDSVGDLSEYELFHNQILVGIYERPEKTLGGIIVTPRMQTEDRYQGVVGLVLKTGPSAFKDDDHNKFHGQAVQPGDWIMYRTSDTWKTSVNGKVCRMLEDAHVKARIPHPDMVL